MGKTNSITFSGRSSFFKRVYDMERFEDLRGISAEIMEEYTDLKMEKIEELFMNETGYQTPKVDVCGAVFKNDKILLVREKMDDNGHYRVDFVISAFRLRKML
ncbi:NUDIX hydrolase N-terminal domain-containing protein [Virgibacillus sp. CBA3643]|uniref:NUDIX hydrolase N-terminal domain-containing protein n=1 Tax=Virgibacillus sp. CBA3643 TaxID=2942278 RepID=UPI0035A34336